MVNLGPQRKTVNETIDLVNSTFNASRTSLSPEFEELKRQDDLKRELDITRQLQQNVREYREDRLYESGDKPPLKNGPLRILRFQLRVLEEELAEHQLRLREQIQIER